MYINEIAEAGALYSLLLLQFMELPKASLSSPQRSSLYYYNSLGRKFQIMGVVLFLAKIPFRLDAM